MTDRESIDDLIDAARDTNLSRVREILARGIDPNVQDQQKQTALPLAVRYAYQNEDNAIQIVEALLEAGAVAGVAVGGERLTLLAVLVPIFLLATLSRGLVSPNVTHAALERIPSMAGAGSALIGSMQMLTGAFAGVIVGSMFDRYGPAGLMMTMASFAVAALLAWFYVERRYR